MSSDAPAAPGSPVAPASASTSPPKAKKVTKAKAPKSPKIKKPKVPSSHPTYGDMVKRAITELKNKNGSSRAVILKYILQNFKVIRSLSFE